MNGLTNSSTFDPGCAIGFDEDLQNDSVVLTLGDIAIISFLERIKTQDPMFFSNFCSNKVGLADPAIKRFHMVLLNRISVHTNRVKKQLKGLGPDVLGEDLKDLVKKNRFVEAVSFRFNRCKKKAQQLTDEGILNLKQCPLLRRISLETMDPGYLSSVDGSSFKEIAESNPFIESLDLKGFDSLEEDNVVPMLQFLPKLEKFALTSAEATTDAMIAALCQHQSVSDLTLYEGSNLTGAGMMQLAKLTSLKELVLLDANQVDQASLAAFLAQSSVTFLIFGGVEIEDEMFTLLPEGFQSNLESLTLSNCKKLTQKSLDEIVEHFPHLKKLAFEECTSEFGTLLMQYQSEGKFSEEIEIEISQE